MGRRFEIVLHQISGKPDEVDAFLHQILDDPGQVIQLLFSFLSFSLPAVFLLQLHSTIFAKVSAHYQTLSAHSGSSSICADTSARNLRSFERFLDLSGVLNKNRPGKTDPQPGRLKSDLSVRHPAPRQKGCPASTGYADHHLYSAVSHERDNGARSDRQSRHYSEQY